MTPSTPSGRRLLADVGRIGGKGVYPSVYVSAAYLAAMIEDVEREAIETYRLDLAEKVRAIGNRETWTVARLDPFVRRTAVLRLIEGEKTP